MCIRDRLEAILLVFLVMFLFLQNFRATLIPTLVVPVALPVSYTHLFLDKHVAQDAADQEIFEVETNKATMGVTTMCGGVLSLSLIHI